MTIKRHERLTKADNAVLDEMQALRQKRQQIKRNFQVALEKAEADVIGLSNKVEELKKEKQDIYTLFVLDSVEASAYSAVEKELQDAEDALQLTKDKIENIKEIEVQEVQEKIQPRIEAIRTDYQQTRNRNTSLIKQDMVEEKNKYLAKFDKFRKQFDVVKNYDLFIDEVDVFTGEKRNRSTFGENAEQFLSGHFTNVGNGNRWADVTEDEIRKAFNK